MCAVIQFIGQTLIWWPVCRFFYFILAVFWQVVLLHSSKHIVCERMWKRSHVFQKSVGCLIDNFISLWIWVVDLKRSSEQFLYCAIFAKDDGFKIETHSICLIPVLKLFLMQIVLSCAEQICQRHEFCLWPTFCLFHCWKESVRMSL